MWNPWRCEENAIEEQQRVEWLLCFDRGVVRVTDLALG